MLFTSEGSHEAPDDDLQFMADGVIHLDFAAGGAPSASASFGAPTSAVACTR